ncbi:MAG TPA: 50S ribosomal protein L1 [Candidatus Saccharimonadales bacterium]|nr:50S ribosomal protein L1 [Candidatus Saccharimonadales bacterium]
MGKVRINTIGDESAEQKQKVKAAAKKEAKAVEAEVKEEKKETVVKPTVETQYVASLQQKKDKRSKKYKEVAMLVDKTKTYSLAEALEVLPKLHLAKFDESVELHINTHTTGISGSITLPHGTGKQTRVAILAPAKDQAAADALLKEIESGTINFDVLIATPDAMPKLAKVARILGPRGLMPNPKNGTVTPKPEEAAQKFAGGQINFKTESKAPVIHLTVGKLSFTPAQLMENIKVAVSAVQTKNIKNITLKSTMSPGLKVQI